MSGDARDWETFIAGVRDGDGATLHAFMKRYGPQLERLAATAIEPGMRRRFGPESIAQSVCRTFVRRAMGDRFEVADGDQLWRLLCAIALTKVREKARYHLRMRRGVDREVRGGVNDAVTERLTDGGPSPEEVVAFQDAFCVAVEELDDQERQILELRIDGRSQSEIGEEIGCSERTVRRVLGRLETRLRGALEA